MEDLGVDFYEDLIAYVLFKFNVNTRNYKVLLLTDHEFDVFNKECDIVKSFYYMITFNPEFSNGKYRDQYLNMITKEYDEFFLQSDDDTYISASLIDTNKVYRTVDPVHRTIEILKEDNSTDKDVTALNSLLTDYSNYKYLILLRLQRHESLLNEDNDDIYLDVIHEAIHIVEHEKPPSWWKFWMNKNMPSEEMESLTYQFYNEWASNL